MADQAAPVALDFVDLEAIDGLRLSWNIWPNSRLEATKCVVPFAAMYTPVRALQDMPVLPYAPIRCKMGSCGGVLNPFARVDFHGKIWICPFCYTRNHFPPHYASIAENNLPAELFPSYTTVEYTLPAPPPSPPAYMFVVDTCVNEEEMGYLKASLSQALSLLPETALVGLVTYGTQVHVHELGFSECAKAYVFRGQKELTKQQVQDALGLGARGAAAQAARAAQQAAGGGSGHGAPGKVGHGRFLLPVSQCEFQLQGVLDELQKDAFAVPASQRASRCTGVALSLVVNMLATMLPGSPARIVLLVGGPCTEGPGMVVSKELSEPVRSHKDLLKDAAPHFRKAQKFYEGVAKQLIASGHVLDLFACSLDQTGLAEMVVMPETTGGVVVLSDSYSHNGFKHSFSRLFAEPADPTSLHLCYQGLFEVLTSRDVKVQGAIGPCATLDKKGPACSETLVGVGNTTAWRMCGLDKSTTMAVFFEVVPTTQAAGAQQSAAGQNLFLQFLTQYLHPSGQTRLRATTVTRAWTEGSTYEHLGAGFDQEAAAVIVSRLSVWKMDHEDDYDATRWLDRMLIRLASKFGDYRKDDPASFSLSRPFSIFPQFMFNLRRSNFVQVFNNSPDETEYFRIILNRESVGNALVMLQPQLLSYSFNGPPEPALLDVASIAPDRILLLDSYFYVVVFHGSTVAQWRKAGYQHQPEHEAFAHLLSAPLEDARAIVRERFPEPNLVECDQGGSQVSEFPALGY
eukprot:jgi/Mesvir1/3718/Mv14997-RA.3